MNEARASLVARNLEATFMILHPEWDSKKLSEFLWEKFPDVMPYRYWRPHTDEEKLLYRGLTFDFSKVTTAILHIGFISISETDEHLSRLDSPVPKESNVARSKIGNTSLKVKPIDSVSRRVANVE